MAVRIQALKSMWLRQMMSEDAERSVQRMEWQRHQRMGRSMKVFLEQALLQSQLQVQAQLVELAQISEALARTSHHPRYHRTAKAFA